MGVIESPFKWKDKLSEFGTRSSMNLTLTGKGIKDLRIYGYVVLTSLHFKSNKHNFSLEWRMIGDSFSNYEYLQGTLEEVKKATIIKLMEDLEKRTKRTRVLHDALLMQLESNNE